MNSAISLLIGWMLDLLIGDPIRLPHPIVWFGKMIAFLEHRLNKGNHRMLKGALMEYYYVDSLEDYDRVYRAVAFYIHKYGRIDWLESLNEYWLPVDARLRTDFNIAVGTREDEIGDLVRKSGMKKSGCTHTA